MPRRWWRTSWPACPTPSRPSASALRPAHRTARRRRTCGSRCSSTASSSDGCWPPDELAHRRGAQPTGRMSPRRVTDMRPVVGFDLDLTLVDSADGIVATFVETARRLETYVDPDVVRALIGVPLEATSEALLAPHLVADGVRTYRDLYPTIGVPGTTLLPGAAEAVSAVNRHGGRAVVVSAKIEPAVLARLHHLGLQGDAPAGGPLPQAKGPGP